MYYWKNNDGYFCKINKSDEICCYTKADWKLWGGYISKLIKYITNNKFVILQKKYYYVL